MPDLHDAVGRVEAFIEAYHPGAAHYLAVTTSTGRHELRVADLRALVDALDGDRVHTEQWACHGDGYDHEIRHRDDAITIAEDRPGVALLVRRNLVVIGPWSDVSDEPPNPPSVCDTPGPGHDCPVCQA